jgi:hypothetical protein
MTISDVIDEKLVEALRLVQCMLEDFERKITGMLMAGLDTLTQL